MIVNKFTAGAAIVFVMLAAVVNAEDARFQSRDAGSYLLEETLIDANGDGKTADLVLMGGLSDQLGQTTTQSVLEWSTDLVQGRCSTGNPGFQATLVGGNAVTHTPNGDLLLIWFDKGTRCVDSVTNTANISLDGTIIGGTGQFFDAIGTAHVNGIVIPEVIVEESGATVFGSMDTETTGTLTRNRYTKS